MNIFHEVKASLQPISIVYDEDALNGLSNLFDTESAFDAVKLIRDINISFKIFFRV